MAGCFAITAVTQSPIEPRCTGICGALATSPPSESKTAQEKSSRSLMFTEEAVFCSVAPISSAMAMNWLANTSSSTGSTSVVASIAAALAVTRLQHQIARGGDLRAPNPSSTTMV